MRWRLASRRACPPALSLGGRARTILPIDAEHGYFVGVDVGETHVYVELFDLLMRTRGAITYTLDAGGHRPEAVVHHIVTGLQTVLDNAGLGQEAVVGIGIGVPGIVERTAQVLVHAASIGWRAVPLTAMLPEHTYLPLFVDNR